MDLTSMPPNVTSPNSMASTSGVHGSKLKGTSKKRQRTSWTDAHTIEVVDNGVSQRRCHHFHIRWSTSTSTGTIAKHLVEKHHLISDSSQTSNITQLIQSTLEPVKVSCVSEKKIDDAITKHTVKATLPHVHVESREFKEFMQ